jgi:hypothetical protein
MKPITDTVTEKTRHAFFAMFKKLAIQNKRDLLQTSSWLIYLSTLIIIPNYFEIQHNYWFLSLIDGYVLKEWLPPLILLLIVLVAKWQTRMIFLQDGIRLLCVSLLFYVFFGFLSLIKNEQLYLIVKYGFIMFGPLTLYAAILLIFTDNISIEKLLKLLFWAGVLLSLHVFYMYNIIDIDTWLNKPFVFKYMWTDETSLLYLSPNYIKTGLNYSYTKSLLFINDSFFAASLAPLILFGFIQTIKSEKLINYIWYLPSFFLYFTLINTASRSAFFGFCVGVLLFLWFIRKKKLHVVIIVIVLTAITMSSAVIYYRVAQLGGGLFQKLFPGLITEEMQVPNSDEIVINYGDNKIYIKKDEHIGSVGKTINYIKDAPLFGNGISYMSKRNEREGFRELNRYLYITVTAGMLTVLPYIFFIFLLLAYSYKRLHDFVKIKNDSFTIGLILFSSVLIFAIQINNCGLESYYYWVFFGLAAAWVRNCYYEMKNEDTSH